MARWWSQSSPEAGSGTGLAEFQQALETRMLLGSDHEDIQLFLFNRPLRRWAVTNIFINSLSSSWASVVLGALDWRFCGTHDGPTSAFWQSHSTAPARVRWTSLRMP